MWGWDQSAGELRHNGRVVSKGYSGNGRGKNKPELQGLAGIGPIPRGRYKIGAPYNSDRVGPYALKLEPVDSHPNDDTHDGTGRGAFRIHGDSVSAPGTASHGCIILPRAVRQTIWASGDRDLEVIE